MIRASVDDGGVNRLLTKIASSGGKPPLRRIGTIMVRSVLRNFAEGGRPEKWAPLAESTRKKRGESARPLMDQGHLRNANVVEIVGSDNVRVVNKLDYAPYQHFGTKGDGGSSAGLALAQGRGKGIPARPFMVLQDDDVREIRGELAKHLERGR